MKQVMHKLILPATLLILAAGADIPLNAASPQVCRGHDEGFEVSTDCYGTTLTGVALRNAQVRELVQQQRSPAEIASILGVRITTYPASQAVCPSGSLLVADPEAENGGSEGRIHCAHYAVQ